MLVEILRPDQQVLMTEVDSCSLPGDEGYLTILPGHTKMVSRLGVGVIQLKGEKEEQFFFVSGGYVEVDQKSVVILGDVIENSHDIDEERARRSIQKAEHQLRGSETVDVERVNKAIARAEARLECRRLYSSLS